MDDNGGNAPVKDEDASESEALERKFVCCAYEQVFEFGESAANIKMKFDDETQTLLLLSSLPNDWLTLPFQTLVVSLM